MMKKLFAILLATVLLCGCSDPGVSEGGGLSIFGGDTQATQPVAAEPGSVAQLQVEELFSDRDKKTEYEADGTITLEGSTVKVEAPNVTVSGTTVTVTGEGVYEVTGMLEDGMIIVDADKKDKVQLVLKNAHITSAQCAPIYVKQADKVFLTLVGENSLENGGTLRAIDSNDIDAAVYARDDLTVNGTGSVRIVSPAGHGISAKDELTITGGSFNVESAEHGLDANDSIAIAGGSFVIASGKDGIHAENNDDAALGYVYIADGSFTVDAQGDGISAGSVMQLDGGSFTIVCGGGAVNGEKTTSDGWGRPGGKGGPGGFGGQQSSSGDSESIKGIKAGGELVINGGSFNIDSADDALHSNADLTVCGGSFALASGDDGIHADEALTIRAGKVDISQSYEGLEGLSVTVSGGEISLKASDDGINAAGGADGSGFGGRDQFGRPGMGGMGGGSSDAFICISGGTVYIEASGDGIDANGNLEITGGHTTVCGPTRGDTAVLDYDISASITGGTFIGTGSYMMAQSFSSSGQGVIALNVGNQPAGTTITVKDSKGNVLVEYAAALEYQIAILSTPEMVKGESYTVTVGQQSGEFEAG